MCPRGAPALRCQRRIVENLASLDFVDKLSEEHMARLAALDTTDGSGRLNKGGSFLQEGQVWQSYWEEDWVEPL